MSKIVINKCFGGFSISLEAAQWMAERDHAVARQEVTEFEQADKWVKSFVESGQWPEECPEEQRKWLEIDAKFNKAKRWFGGARCIERNDPLLVSVVELLGDKANGECAELCIVEIPDGVKWQIEEYDGNEHIAEQHQTWS